MRTCAPGTRWSLSRTWTLHAALAGADQLVGEDLPVQRVGGDGDLLALGRVPDRTQHVALDDEALAGDHRVVELAPRWGPSTSCSACRACARPVQPTSHGPRRPGSTWAPTRRRRHSRAGATSEAISPQAAKRATNLERTKTPTWHQRRPDQRFPRRGGTSPVLARTSATISATSRDADSRSSSVVTVSGSRPDAPPASAVSADRSPSTWKPRSAINAVAARSSSANRSRWCSGSRRARAAGGPAGPRRGSRGSTRRVPARSRAAGAC